MEAVKAKIRAIRRLSRLLHALRLFIAFLRDGLDYLTCWLKQRELNTVGFPFPRLPQSRPLRLWAIQIRGVQALLCKPSGLARDSRAEPRNEVRSERRQWSPNLTTRTAAAARRHGARSSLRLDASARSPPRCHAP